MSPVVLVLHTVYTIWPQKLDESLTNVCNLSRSLMKSCDIIRSCCDQSITVMNHISYEVVTPPATKPHINNDVFVLMDCRPHLRLPQSSFHGHNTADENAQMLMLSFRCDPVTCETAVLLWTAPYSFSSLQFPFRHLWSRACCKPWVSVSSFIAAVRKSDVVLWGFNLQPVVYLRPRLEAGVRRRFKWENLHKLARYLICI